MDDILYGISFLTVVIAAVGIGAVIYHDWKDTREFDRWWEERNGHGR